MAEVLSLACILEAGDPGGVYATIPALPGCFVEGKNRDEAISRARELGEQLLAKMVGNEEELPSEELEAVMLDLTLPEGH
ncbi:MAG TPA: hypothetical protein VGN26_11975 [Armatimonadota bacterium]